MASLALVGPCGQRVPLPAHEVQLSALYQAPLQPVVSLRPSQTPGCVVLRNEGEASVVVQVRMSFNGRLRWTRDTIKSGSQRRIGPGARFFKDGEQASSAFSLVQDQPQQRLQPQLHHHQQQRRRRLLL